MKNSFFTHRVDDYLDVYCFCCKLWYKSEYMHTSLNCDFWFHMCWTVADVLISLY